MEAIKAAVDKMEGENPLRVCAWQAGGRVAFLYVGKWCSCGRSYLDLWDVDSQFVSGIPKSWKQTLHPA